MRVTHLTAMCLVLGSSAGAAPSSTKPLPRGTASLPLVYVSQSTLKPELQAVQFYRAGVANPPVLGAITGFMQPEGMTTDANGRLYVTDVLANAVYVFAPGGTQPAATYTSGLAGPIAVGLDKAGLIYVASYNAGAQGTVTVYKPGTPAPVRTITGAAFFGGSPVSLVVDTAGTLFVAYETGTGGGVKRFAPGDNTGVDQGIRLTSPGELKLDAKGDYVLCDQSSNMPGLIDTIKQQKTTPSREIRIRAFPYAIAFDRAFTYLYNANYNGNSHGIPAALDVFDYATGKLAWSISAGLTNRTTTASGVAVSPPAPPVP